MQLEQGLPEAPGQAAAAKMDLLPRENLAGDCRSLREVHKRSQVRRMPGKEVVQLAPALELALEPEVPAAPPSVAAAPCHPRPAGVCLCDGHGHDHRGAHDHDRGPSVPPVPVARHACLEEASCSLASSLAAEAAG